MPLPQRPGKQRYSGSPPPGLTPSSWAWHGPPLLPPPGLTTSNPGGASLTEMRSFIASMQAKYGLVGSDSSSPEPPESPITGDPLRRLNAVRERLTATLASFDVPYAAAIDVSGKFKAYGEEEVVRAQGLQAPAQSPTVTACACTCRCSEVAAEAAALRVLVADLRGQQEALRRDLEEYAASTGAVLESLQAGLRRQKGSGGGVGGSL